MAMVMPVLKDKPVVCRGLIGGDGSTIGLQPALQTGTHPGGVGRDLDRTYLESRKSQKGAL